jgi:GT2 family glycosyltransferase
VFVAFDRRVRVHLGVVTLGAPDRLGACLEALVRHESRHDFVVSLLVNPMSVSGEPAPPGVPPGIRVETAGSNLGWAGGLQRLRALSDAELFAWVQDDMRPQPGWLDALVEAADSVPTVGMFGSVGLDETGKVVLHNGGMAVPPGDVARWSSTDTTPAGLPDGITILDWVTSKGCLTRVAAFDEVGGPDPRLWPLNRVDLDYGTHLRCHGWDVALVPGARVEHAGSRSSPSAFRTFLLEWRDHWFDERWAGPAGELHGRTSAVVDHPCADWRTVETDAIETASGRAATRMAVPLARWNAARAAESAELAAAELAAARSQIDTLTSAVAELEGRLRIDAARRRRLRRRLARAEARLAGHSGSGGLWTRVARRLRA